MLHNSPSVLLFLSVITWLPVPLSKTNSAPFSSNLLLFEGYMPLFKYCSNLQYPWITQVIWSNHCYVLGLCYPLTFKAIFLLYEHESALRMTHPTSLSTSSLSSCTNCISLCYNRSLDLTLTKNIVLLYKYFRQFNKQRGVIIWVRCWMALFWIRWNDERLDFHTYTGHRKKGK